VQERQYKPGETIFREGDPSEYAHVVDVGLVEISKVIDGQLVVLSQLGPGEIFGEMGLVDERPRSALARAVVQTQTRTLTKSRFLEVLRTDPDEALAYLKALFERLRTMNARVDIDGDVPVNAPDGRDLSLRLLPTNKATIAVLPEGGLPIEQVPFRVGRAHGGPLDTNDLALMDHKPYTVSRHHFVIEVERDGYVVCDRGSFLGTIVNGKRIGGSRHDGRALLAVGRNLVIVGDEHSRFRFELEVPPLQ
jgi:CRP-like cAMP-binding protein